MSGDAMNSMHVEKNEEQTIKLLNLIVYTTLPCNRKCKRKLHWA